MNPPSAGLDPPGRRSRATPTRISRVPHGRTPAGHDADPAGDPGTVCSAWSLTITCLSAMTDRDQRFVIIWLQIAHIADYLLISGCGNRGGVDCR